VTCSLSAMLARAKSHPTTVDPHPNRLPSITHRFHCHSSTKPHLLPRAACARGANRRQRHKCYNRDSRVHRQAHCVHDTRRHVMHARPQERSGAPRHRGSRPAGPVPRAHCTRTQTHPSPCPACTAVTDADLRAARHSAALCARAVRPCAARRGGSLAPDDTGQSVSVKSV
jgi:hypothetical protein